MNFRRIDLFSSKFNFNVDENFIQKGTCLGSFYSIISVFLILSYLFYTCTQYANNQIEPVYRSQNLINNSTQEIDIIKNVFAYKINYRFLTPNNMQDMRNLWNIFEWYCSYLGSSFFIVML
ncbi:hypothetical protein ABPG72_001609 [Tetrahymena utriculariae]